MVAELAVVENAVTCAFIWRWVRIAYDNGYHWQLSLGKLQTVVGAALLGAFILCAVVIYFYFLPLSILFPLVDLCSS